jgi:tetratricopeptide (TPR) repeat protein
VLAQFEADVRDTSLWRASEPAVRSVLGEIALSEGRPLVALDEFRRADRLPDGPVHRCAICRDVGVGRAFDQAGMPDSAIATFEHYLVRFNMDSRYTPAILHRLGELHEAKGNRTKAIEYYARFVELWRNADPELQPRVAEVRRRMQTLRDRGGD